MAGGSAPASPLLTPLLDLDVSDLLRSEEFLLNESWEPLTMGALCFHPALSKCVARGRHGRLAVVDYGRASRSRVRNINIHELERVRAPQPLARAVSGAHLGSGEGLADMTQMALINEHCHGQDEPHPCLLCCTTDDGAVHLCRCWGCDDHDAAVVCTFQALPRRQSAGTCMHWLQHRAQLVAAGRDPHIRIWDLEHERLLHSFKHNSMHYVACVTQCATVPEPDPVAGSTVGSLVYVGCGDGKVLAVDFRTVGGIVQSYKGHLESVTSITPGVYSPGDQGSSPFLVASSDPYGVVDIWDVRGQRSQACYQLGVSTASEMRPHREFEKFPALCNVLAHRGLVASVRLPQSPTEEIALSCLASGKRQISFPLERGAQPFAMGYHPTRDTFGIFAQKGDSSRLLLYSNAA